MHSYPWLSTWWRSRLTLAAGALVCLFLSTNRASAAPVTVAESVSCSIGGVSISCPASTPDTAAIATASHSVTGIGTGTLEVLMGAQAIASNMGNPVATQARATVDLIASLKGDGPARPGLISYVILTDGQYSGGPFNISASIGSLLHAVRTSGPPIRCALLPPLSSLSCSAFRSMFACLPALR
jgi:hypothetical protein